MENSTNLPVSSESASNGLDIPRLFKESWEDLKVLWKSMLKVQLVMLGLIFAVLAIPVLFLMIFGGVTAVNGLISGSIWSGLSISETAAITIITLFLVVFIALIYVSLLSQCSLFLIVKDRKTNLKVLDIFKEAKQYLSGYFYVSLLVGLRVLVGLILFIIPGIIFAIRYSFSSWVYIDEGLKGGVALKRSKELVAGFGWQVLGIMGIFLLINFVIEWVLKIFPKQISSILSFPISLFFGIYAIIVFFNLYHKIKELKSVSFKAQE